VLHHQPGTTSGLTEIEAWGSGALPLPPPTADVENLAWNPGDRPFPRVRASFTGSTDRVEQAVDGRLTFTYYSRNRWTSSGSPNAEDWLEVDFGGVRRVGRLDLYLYGDGYGAAAPRAFRVEAWVDGAWEVAVARSRTPEQPTAWALNRVELAQPVETARVRVVFTHDGPLRSGLTELRIFPAESREP
jgi:hypothetical protein